MRLYCGIIRDGDTILIAALNEEGRDLLRCQVPIGRRGEKAAYHILYSLHRAFGAEIIVSLISGDDAEKTFLRTLSPSYCKVITIPPSALYQSPLRQDEPFVEPDLYQDAMILAVLGSLKEYASSKI